MEKCNVDNLTFGQVKELRSIFGGGVTQNIQNANQDHPFEIGKKYLIRTVTMIQTGMVKSIRGKFLVLEQAAWIADTGRFSEALEDQEKMKEVEPFKNDAIVNMDTIIDATEITVLIRKLK
jgi:hypothetical protein